MARVSGITVHDGIGPVLDYMVAHAAVNVAQAMEHGKDKVEMYAKQNAVWEDRTGAARAGLTAAVYEEGGFIVLELAHTVDYGIWLELIKDGSYAIIMPTLEAVGPEVIRDAGGEVLRTPGSFI